MSKQTYKCSPTELTLLNISHSLVHHLTRPENTILYLISYIFFRLRNSGLNKEQVANAFDAMERLDKELGPVYSIPITQVANAVVSSRQFRKFKIYTGNLFPCIQTFQQMQAQASQVANQVASQLALSAQVAKAAHVAQAQAQATAQSFNNHPLMNQQPVFPHPIPIAPVNPPTSGGASALAKANFNRMMAQVKENGVASSTSQAFSPQTGSPPPVNVTDFNRA